MRRLLVMIGATWLALLGAGIASADVFVFATIDKDKDKFIFEQILVNKFVDLRVFVPLLATKAAESEALVNQSNWNNRSCTNCDEKRDTILDSGNANSGVLSINQAAGNMNNQGNAVSIGVDVLVTPGRPDGPPPPRDPESSGFAEAQAAVDQRNGVPSANFVDTVNLLFRDGLIADSLNDNTGVIHANQAPGNMNNQANALSVAVSLDAGVALSEADLGQVNVQNVVRESDASAGSVGINKRADIRGSINGNTGIVGVNQAVGNMANQANVVSVAAALSQ